MHDDIKTLKIKNLARVITSGCSTAVESWLIFVEKEIKKLSENLPSQTKDANDMLNLRYIFNNSAIPKNAFLISSDVVNMFPSIHNESRIKSVQHLFNTRSNLNPPTLCVLEALRLCLECNIAIFDNNFSLRTDRAVQDPHMSCSYSDIVIAMNHNFKTLIWKRFRDDAIALWTNSDKDANRYLNYFNIIDVSDKIRCTMETDNENGLEILDLRPKLKACTKITVDFCSH